MKQPTRTEAIKNFLLVKTHRDLADLYTYDQEVQVNVGRDGGIKVESGDYLGKGWIEWTDGIQTWKPFRIPINANSEPEFKDSALTWSFDEHVEGIGMTGWDWTHRCSRWVAFDFDAMVGHSDKHAKKLSDEELKAVETTLREIPFITIRRSTGGKGLHIYVFLEPVPTSNHTEHAALARAILSMLSGLTGTDFSSKVDVCGGNMWVWHRKMLGTNGLTLVKQGTKLSTVPPNWRDHLNVVSRKQRRVMPSFVEDLDPNDPERLFAELSGQRTRIKLDAEHRRLIDWLSTNNCQWWWDDDNHMLVTHTMHLKEAHSQLHMRGRFDTNASGKDLGYDHNCFAFPIRNGGWAIRRYTRGIKEHPSWEQDGQNFTRCFFNREPDLPTVARLNEGVEHEKGGYYFRTAEEAIKALAELCVTVELPNFVLSRGTIVKHLKGENKLVVHINAESSDNGTLLKGWLNERGKWKRVYPYRPITSPEAESNENFDDLVRHIVSTRHEDAGWVLRRDGVWSEEPLPHIKAALGSMGQQPKEINNIIGGAVFRAWRLVNRPFQPEYPGDREWNRNSAQFRVVPTLDTDNLSFPTWKRILQHCGQSLDEAIKNNAWARGAGLACGADYLKLWIANLIKRPHSPSAYLAFYGEQDSGKSVFHEAMSQVLIRGGVMRADAALTSQSLFNGELLNAILCVVEETDLKANKPAYNRIKDWVTSPELLIHPKHGQPFMADNCTHWVQCANELEACPVFEGDTRITLIYVPELSPTDKIPKPELMERLRKEAPDFLASLLAMELPESNDRLAVPMIATEAKARAAEKNMNQLELFLRDKTYVIPGTCVSIDDMFDHFHLFLNSTGGEAEASKWSKQRMIREMPERISKCRGRVGSNQHVHYGNLTVNPDEKPDRPFYKDGLFLKRELASGADSGLRPQEANGKGHPG